MEDGRVEGPLALGTIVEWPQGELGRTEVYSGLLDYYDGWNDIDARLKEHHKHLSLAASAFGHDLVNMATYAHEILGWLSPDRITDRKGVVVVGGMTEAFLVSIRSACDAVAGALAYRACTKLNQAPKNSLKDLLKWAKDHETRVEPAILKVLSGDFSWLMKLRNLRDRIVHDGTDAVIHCNGRQFNLWLYSARFGWATQEPLLPLLRDKYQSLLTFADAAADAINQTIEFPPDRLRSRCVSGLLIPALHELVSVADRYSEPVALGQGRGGG